MSEIPLCRLNYRGTSLIRNRGGRVPDEDDSEEDRKVREVAGSLGFRVCGLWFMV